MSFITGNGAFPAFDWFHAHCAINVVFEKSSCSQVFNLMKDTVQTWHPETGGANGTYKVWSGVEL